MVLLGVCGTAIVVSGSYYAINVHNNSIADDGEHWVFFVKMLYFETMILFSFLDEKPPSPYQDGDVCLTAECAIAGK